MITCVFCQIVAKKEPARVVFEDKLCLAFLDKYPKSRGHLQLIPKIHYRWIYEMPNMGEFFTAAGRLIRGIIPILGADHVTIATFGHEIEHAHVWIVPHYLSKVRIQEFMRPSEINQNKELAEMLQQALLKEVLETNGNS